MVNVKHVLCPVDFSEPSRYAVEHAVQAARWWHAQITAVHVHSILMPWGSVPGVHGNVPVLPAPEPHELIGEIFRFYAALSSAGHTDVVVREGSPAKEIVRLADEIAADLIVMGTHGRGGFDRLVLGSVTDKVLRTTRTPVLTVSPQTRSAAATPVQYAAVLCAIDFSDASMRALQYALAFAKRAAAKVILLHVVEGISDLPLETSQFQVPEYGASVAQDAKTQLAAAIPDSLRGEYVVEEHVTIGKAHREILRLAADVNADLIVLGAHGKGAIERWFGSTTTHVTREARCPVLTVPGAIASVGVADVEPSDRRPS